jgi:hypothetical protein
MVEMTAQDILKLMLAKHSDDLCIPECKNGSTHRVASDSKMRRMDLFVVKKSYAHPLNTCYEIKTSRQDFLGDKKHLEYLHLCNAFYFVCPHGIIDKNEIPEAAGLMEVTRVGNKLFTRKKAQYRDIADPIEVYKYILFSRVKIIPPRYVDKIEYWRAWLAERDEQKAIGHNVSAKIGELVYRKIDVMGRKNERLKEENEMLKEAKIVLEKLGVNVFCLSAQNIESEIASALRKIENGTSLDLLKWIDMAMQDLNNIKTVIKKDLTKI